MDASCKGWMDQQRHRFFWGSWDVNDETMVIDWEGDIVTYGAGWPSASYWLVPDTNIEAAA